MRPARLISSLLLVATSALPAASPAATGPGAALWIWEDASAKQVRFAKRQGFGDLYVQLIPGRAERSRVRTLLRAAEQREISVWAMGGRASWATSHGPMLKLARRAARSGKFAGVVLDVEPHVLPEWDEPASRTRLLRSFLRGLERTVREAGDLPVFVAVPFWFDHDGYRYGRITLLRAILERVDGVIVMAYRDRADGRDGIIRLAGDEIRLASALGKKAVIGVQASPDEIDKLGFAEEGLAALRHELGRVQMAFAAEPGFGGIAVHHYGSLRALPRR